MAKTAPKKKAEVKKTASKKSDAKKAAPKKLKAVEQDLGFDFKVVTQIPGEIDAKDEVVRHKFIDKQVSQIAKAVKAAMKTIGVKVTAFEEN